MSISTTPTALADPDPDDFRKWEVQLAALPPMEFGPRVARHEPARAEAARLAIEDSLLGREN